MTTATHQYDDFRQKIEEAGLTAPHTFEPGQIVRFPGAGKSNGNTAGWAWLSEDGQGGAFGDWSTGFSDTWHARRSVSMTAAEQAAHKQRVITLQRVRKEEYTKAHVEAAKQAQTLWQAAALAGADHPYLIEKRVQPHGLRVDDQERLIVPVLVGGTCTSLQFIDRAGQKKFLPGGTVKGGSYTIGDLPNAATILLAEGFATGASLYDATGYPTVVAFSATNLKPVAEAIRHQHSTATILVCGDNDIHADSTTPNTGKQQAQLAAESIGGKWIVPELSGSKCDWNDVAMVKGLPAVRAAINAALNTFEASVGSFAPVPLAQLLDEPEPLEPDWILDELLAAGCLASLISKPKVGKSTLAYELAVNVAHGRPFLGRAVKQGPVLILAMEEHCRDVKRRLRNLGADQCAIRVHSGPLTDAPDTLHEVQTYIEQHQIVLVIFDTLNTYWSVSEENDAGAVTRALKPLLQLARGTGAAVLLLHHARKAEGEFGDEIRGSGAIFSLLDVALSLKRHDVETQRRLVIISRYAEAPPELLLELRESGYVSLGDPAAASKAAKLDKLANALSDTPTEAKTIAMKAGLSAKAAYPLLNHLVDRHNVSRTGTGKKGDPFVFAKCVSFPAPKSGGLEETNLGPSTGRHESNTHDGFDASDPLTIGSGKEKHFTDSFPPTPVPPGSNELKEVDLVD